MQLIHSKTGRGPPVKAAGRATTVEATGWTSTAIKTTRAAIKAAAWASTTVEAASPGAPVKTTISTAHRHWTARRAKLVACRTVIGVIRQATRRPFI